MRASYLKIVSFNIIARLNITLLKQKYVKNSEDLNSNDLNNSNYDFMLNSSKVVRSDSLKSILISEKLKSHTSVKI